MRVSTISTIGLMALVVLGLIGACSNSKNPIEPTEFPDPVDAVATDILLSIYSTATWELVNTVHLDSEAPVMIDAAHGPGPVIPGQYYVYACASGFYTELYVCDSGEVIEVDLDGIPDAGRGITGTLFGHQVFSVDVYGAYKDLTLKAFNGDSWQLMTDDQGRFGLGGLPAGKYEVYLFQPDTFFVIEHGNVTDYHELTYVTMAMDRAPYLYLYPPEETDVSIAIEIPSGGGILNSEPPYENGWSVSVEPDGTIDGTYPYLFYEAEVSFDYNLSCGWLLNGSDLENEWRRLLDSLGLVGREIDDFVDFWIPKIGEVPWLAVYPQNAEAATNLDILPPADRILRLLFVLRKAAGPIDIEPPPEAPPFERQGFTVVEWGVLGPSK